MRERTHWSMVALLVGGMTAAVASLRLHGASASLAPQIEKTPSGRLSIGTNAQPCTFVADATGTPVPVAEYQRIVSGSSIADAILPDLVSTERIVGVSSWYADKNPQAARLSGKRHVSGLYDLERVVSLRPDLVIVSNYSADPGPIERLRERGIPVFDLGSMLGQRTLERNLRDLGRLLKQPVQAEQVAQQFHRRMSQVAAHVPPNSRKRALYVNLYDTQLHGGTLGSSYYDVLTAAGLLDVAAIGRREGERGSAAWPRYRPEDLLQMDPDVIVTIRGKGKLICAMSGLERLKACRTSGGVLELDEWQLNDPGPGMLGASEVLCDLAYPTSKAAMGS
ncbi:MAG TPA: ABC transporter substrate-binding protein [Polyangiaceae bacterium]